MGFKSRSEKKIVFLGIFSAADAFRASPILAFFQKWQIMGHFNENFKNSTNRVRIFSKIFFRDFFFWKIWPKLVILRHIRPSNSQNWRSYDFVKFSMKISNFAPQPKKSSSRFEIVIILFKKAKQTQIFRNDGRNFW